MHRGGSQGGRKHAGVERRGLGWAGARTNLREARSLPHGGCHRGMRGVRFYGGRRSPCCMNQNTGGDSILRVVWRTTSLRAQEEAGTRGLEMHSATPSFYMLSRL